MSNLTYSSIKPSLPEKCLTATLSAHDDSRPRLSLGVLSSRDFVRELVQLDQDRSSRIPKLTGQDAADRCLADTGSFSDSSLGMAGHYEEGGSLLSCANRHGHESEVVSSHSIRKRIAVNAKPHNELRKGYAFTHICNMSNADNIVKKNLEWLIAQRKTNPYELQRATGVPQPTIHRILTGESSDPRTKTLQPLADFFKVSLADLRERDLSAPLDALEGLKPGSYMRVDAAGQNDSRFTLIPKVRLRLTAGISGFEVEPEPFDGTTAAVPTEWIARNGYDRSKLIAIIVRGESMETTFHEGDLVVVNTADQKLLDGAIYAVNYEGEPVVKRLTRDAGQWWLTSDNPDQRRFYRRTCDETTKIIGRVVRKESERF